MTIKGQYQIRDSGRGYDEVLFDEPQDISDEQIDDTSAALCEALETVTEEDLDWRDDQTVWIWYE